MTVVGNAGQTLSVTGTSFEWEIKGMCTFVGNDFGFLKLLSVLVCFSEVVYTLLESQHSQVVGFEVPCTMRLKIQHGTPPNV